jgi:hypothetical protein
MIHLGNTFTWGVPTLGAEEHPGRKNSESLSQIVQHWERTPANSFNSTGTSTQWTNCLQGKKLLKQFL